MSTCSCGITPPKALEKDEYATVETAYDTLRVSQKKGKKFTTFEYFLIILLLLILFGLIKDIKFC